MRALGTARFNKATSVPLVSSPDPSSEVVVDPSAPAGRRDFDPSLPSVRMDESDPIGIARSCYPVLESIDVVDGHQSMSGGRVGSFKDVPDAESLVILDFERPLTEVSPSQWSEERYSGGGGGVSCPRPLTAPRAPSTATRRQRTEPPCNIPTTFSGFGHKKAPPEGEAIP